MKDLHRAMENTAVLLVVIFSAPLAALLFAVPATYLFLVFSPELAASPDSVWALFGASFAAIYLSICCFAMRRE